MNIGAIHELPLLTYETVQKINVVILSEAKNLIFSFQIKKIKR
jgi:hypothetical protein